jgi:hypothetical protein
MREVSRVPQFRSAMALVHGSGFRRIMVVKFRSGVTPDEVSETQPVQVREIPEPVSPRAVTQDRHRTSAERCILLGRWCMAPGFGASWW